MIRLIAMDNDGTLLRPSPTAEKPLNKAVAEALQAAQAAGIHLAIATGRVPNDASFIMQDIGIDAHILALNGSCCLDHPFGPIIEAHNFTTEEIIPICRVLDENSIFYGLFGDNELIISNGTDDDASLNRYWGTYFRREGSGITVQVDRGIAQRVRKGAQKLLIFSEEGERVLGPIRQFLQKNRPQFVYSASWHNNIEVNPSGVDKGMAVQNLAKRLGISMDEVMTIGDNTNDVPMLKIAGYGVAMGNACADAKAAANYIAPSNAEDGVAAAIRELALGEPMRLMKKVDRA